MNGLRAAGNSQSLRVSTLRLLQSKRGRVMPQPAEGPTSTNQLQAQDGGPAVGRAVRALQGPPVVPCDTLHCCRCGIRGGAWERWGPQTLGASEDAARWLWSIVWSGGTGRIEVQRIGGPREEQKRRKRSVIVGAANRAARAAQRGIDEWLGARLSS
ncbi:hypothetical protein ANO11243_010950 [Dothideomycetidae sp. 11243]|nr:hypothetical protein ANO11243_010950 [fungal sp. No.11243]